MFINSKLKAIQIIGQKKTRAKKEIVSNVDIFVISSMVRD